MASTLYCSPLSYSATGGDAGAPPGGYPASNVETPRIARYWQGDPSTLQQVQLDLGSEVAVNAMILQYVNMASVSVFKSGHPISWQSVGVVASQGDSAGRHRVLVSIEDIIRYIRIEIAAGSPLFGDPYWRIGAAYVFASKVDPLPKTFRYGVGQAYAVPNSSAQLPNGRQATVELGPQYSTLDVQVDDVWGQSQDGMELYRRLRAGICGLDVGYHGWDFWPLELDDQAATLRWAEIGVDRVSLRLREVV